MLSPAYSYCIRSTQSNSLCAHTQINDKVDEAGIAQRGDCSAQKSKENNTIEIVKERALVEGQSDPVFKRNFIHHFEITLFRLYPDSIIIGGNNPSKNTSELKETTDRNVFSPSVVANLIMRQLDHSLPKLYKKLLPNDGADHNAPNNCPTRFEQIFDVKSVQNVARVKGYN